MGRGGGGGLATAEYGILWDLDENDIKRSFYVKLFQSAVVTVMPTVIISLYYMYLYS